MSKYMVLENQLPTASFLGSHRGSPFFLSSGSSFFPPFFRTYLMFLKTIHSIDLWSTCLNLLGDYALRSITVLRPRLFSTLTRWQVIVQSSPEVNSFANLAASFLTAANESAYSLLYAASKLGCLWKQTVNTVSEKVSISSASPVMFIPTSFSKWVALAHFSRISFETVLLSPLWSSTTTSPPRRAFTW